MNAAAYRLLFVMSCSLAGNLHGADFEVKQRQIEVPEMPVRTEIYFSLGTNEVSFIPEFGWTLEFAPAEKMFVFNHLSRDLVVTMQFVPEPKPKKSEPKPEDLRQLVINRFPEATIVDEFEGNTRSGAARFFELNRLMLGRPVATRLGFLSIPGYTVNFTLNSELEKIKENHYSFASFLSSIKIEPLAMKPAD